MRICKCLILEEVVESFLLMRKMDSLRRGMIRMPWQRNCLQIEATIRRRSAANTVDEHSVQNKTYSFIPSTVRSRLVDSAVITMTAERFL